MSRSIGWWFSVLFLAQKLLGLIGKFGNRVLSQEGEENSRRRSRMTVGISGKVVEPF